MQRCLELAKRGAGYVAPNPMVGAVLVHRDRIIGEGWHGKYGEAHAEVNCIHNAITNGYGQWIKEATLYVSLEPCAHFGKTPPCTDLIIKQKIPVVVIGCRDPFEQVNGKGIGKLKEAGIDTVVGILEEQCRELNKRFYTFHTKQRPYVVLKWAQTGEGVIGTGGNRVLISNEYTNRIVHKWRSEEAAILVGTRTALADDPALTTRLWPGPSPVRMVVDLDLKLPTRLKLFDGKSPLIVFNSRQHSLDEKIDHLMPVNYYRVHRESNLVPQILAALYKLRMQSLVVEGGARLLQSFIDANAWDEARIITSPKKQKEYEGAIMAPKFEKLQVFKEYNLGSDRIEFAVPQ